MSEASGDTETAVPPDQDHSAPLARVREGFDLGVDKKYSLVVEPWEVLGCGSLPGIAFRFGDSFPIPRVAEALSGIVDLVAAKGSEGKLVAFGHTDAVGADGANLALSERRAKAVVALLTNSLSDFQAIDSEEGWGTEAVQTCLLEVGYRPGPVDGEDGPKTQAAVEAFQTDQGLDVDGIAGPQTREALYREYLAALSPELPADAFLDPPALGCGETNPVVETDQACEDNRRVTFFMFKANRPPLLPDCHDAAGEWYGKLAEACDCGAPPPPTTTLTLGANGAGANAGPPIDENATLRVVHPGGGPPPQGSFGAPEVWLRAETEPPIAGTYRWSCAETSVDGQGQEAAVLLDDECPEQVVVTCELTSAAGNVFVATHTLHTGFLVRFERQGQEVVGQPAPRGTGEDEEQESFVEYEGEELYSVDDIHQDDGDGDCGPTCAVYLRYGGAQASGAPQEHDQTATGGTVQSLAERMRQETSASGNHSQGTTVEQMCEILREFAGSWRTRRYDWDSSNEIYDCREEEGRLQISKAQFVRRMRELLEQSPRGVLTGVISYPGGMPFREALRTAVAEDRDIAGTPHWVICLEIDLESALFFDPGFGQSGRRRFETLDFFLGHMVWAKDPIEPWSGIGSRLVASTPSERRWQIPAETGICELDAGSMTWGERLVSTHAAEWYPNPDEADAEARSYAEGGTNVVVIEVPPGNFGVVRVGELSNSNARQPTPDRSDSESSDILKSFGGVLGSLNFFLRSDEDVIGKLLRYRGSHRRR